MSRTGDTTSPLAFARWLGLIVIAVAFFCLAYLSWQTWPDILIDYGRELYVPWQLSEGRTLYTEIAYFNGPLSPYLNALWFGLFGPSILTLSVANLVIAAAITVLLYRIVTFISDHTTASVACLMFVLVFAFGQLVRVGNYNYISPYSHEMTHGMLLSLLGLDLLIRARGERRVLFIVGAGLSLGLVFLTKPELFLAAALAQVVGVACLIKVERPAAGKAAALIGAFLASTAAPVLAALILLSTAMGAAEALHGTLGGWPSVFNHELTSLRFYEYSMGMNDPGANLWKMLLWVGGYAVLLVPAAMIDAVVRGGRGVRLAVCAVVFLVVIAALFVADVAWISAFRPLPLLILAAAAIAFIAVAKSPGGTDQAAVAVGRLVMLIFAGSLMGKIVLFSRLHHYGFVLAMPAMMMLIVMLFHDVPTWLVRRRGCGLVFRAAAVAGLCVVAIVHVRTYFAVYVGKTHHVGSGADLIWAFPEKRSEELSGLLDGLDALMIPGDTLAVLPEGVMVNFLTRRANPTPYVNFMPPEFIIFGEDAMLRAFEADPPDMIVVIPKNTSEYGMGMFGRGYGEALLQWVRDGYQTVAQVGQTLVLRRRDRLPQPPAESIGPDPPASG